MLSRILGFFKGCLQLWGPDYPLTRSRFIGQEFGEGGEDGVWFFMTFVEGVEGSQK